MSKSKRPKPGPGWKWVGGPVWERNDGVRIHILGMISTRNEIVSANDLRFYARFCELIRVTGGNRKRALMILAGEAVNKNV